MLFTSSPSLAQRVQHHDLAHLGGHVGVHVLHAASHHDRFAQAGSQLRRITGKALVFPVGVSEPEPQLGLLVVRPTPILRVEVTDGSPQVHRASHHGSAGEEYLVAGFQRRDPLALGHRILGLFAAFPFRRRAGVGQAADDLLGAGRIGILEVVAFVGDDQVPVALPEVPPVLPQLAVRHDGHHVAPWGTDHGLLASTTWMSRSSWRNSHCAASRFQL